VDSAILLGWKRQIWPLTVSSIGGTEIQPDTQLVLMGVVNKMMDYLLTYGIEHMAALILTAWMTGQPAANPSIGVLAVDFELNQELLRPWVAIRHFVTMWRSYNIRAKRRSRLVILLRFLISLACSMCFLLSAAAMNTMGLPKQRWYPDLWPNSTVNNDIMTMSTPRMSLASIDWSNYRDMGLNTVSNGSQWSIAAAAFASASSYTTLASLDKLYQPFPRTWRGVKENDTYQTLINTNINRSGVKSTSIQGSYVTDIYHNAKATGPSYARSSTGMLGSVTLTLPMLTTICNAGTTTELKPRTLLVQTSRPTAMNGTLTLQIWSNEETSFAGATCLLNLQQVLFPVHFWLKDDSGFTFWLTDGSGLAFVDVPYSESGPITVLPPSTVDKRNLERLAGQFSLMLPHLDGLLPNSSFAEHLVLAARRLKQSAPGFDTEIESLAPVVALTMQRLLTTATWTMTASPTTNVTSFPIRWYVYGSGPRLNWQWVTGAIFSVLILILSYGVYLMLRYRMAPGPWLKLGGMLNAANAADKMYSVHRGCAGVVSKDGKRAEYFVREVREGEAEIVDAADKGIVLEKGKIYGDAEERWRQMVRECLDEMSSNVRRRSNNTVCGSCIA
jgi:hypothetical protein